MAQRADHLQQRADHLEQGWTQMTQQVAQQVAQSTDDPATTSQVAQQVALIGSHTADAAAALRRSDPDSIADARAHWQMAHDVMTGKGTGKGRIDNALWLIADDLEAAADDIEAASEDIDAATEHTIQQIHTEQRRVAVGRTGHIYMTSGSSSSSGQGKGKGKDKGKHKGKDKGKDKGTDNEDSDESGHWELAAVGRARHRPY